MAALLLGAALATLLLSSNLPAGALPLLRAEWGASAAELGWVLTAYQLGYAVAVVLVLPLTDRVSVARVIGAGAVLAGLANLVFPLAARDVWSASLLRAIAGGGVAGVYMPGVRLVAAAAPIRRRGLLVGTFVASFYLGAALSFLLIGALLEPLGWVGTGVVLGVVGLAAVPFALAGARGAPSSQAGRARLDLSVLRDGPLVRTIAAYIGHSWELFVARGWLAAFLAAAFVAGGASQTAAAASASRWAAVMLALGVPAVFFGGALSDRLGRARTALAVALISGALSLSMGALLDAPWPLLALAGLAYGAVTGADSAVYSVAVTELAPGGRIGSAQAVQAFGGFGVGGLGPVVAGWALDLGLGWVGVFASAGLVGLASAAVLFPLARARSGV